MRRRGNWVNGRAEKRKRTRGDDDEKGRGEENFKEVGAVGSVEAWHVDVDKEKRRRRRRRNSSNSNAT
ncbi:hypothetical protein ACSQ67_003769 [Phaseolus vulgaris]